MNGPPGLNHPLKNIFNTGLALKGVTDRQLQILLNPNIVKNEAPHNYYSKLCKCVDLDDLCQCYKYAIQAGDKRFIAGSGVNGAIWKLKNKQTGEIVVQKKFTIGPSSDNGKVEREIALHYMAQKECENVSQIRDIFRVDRTKRFNRKFTDYYVMMENCEGGELFDYLIHRMQKKSENNDATIFTERELADIIRQICSALNHLHATLGIAHRDLKPENLLLTKNFTPLSNGRVKLSDFGFAKEASNNQLKTACYTPYYAPPEVLSSGNYNYACDIWSLGVILYILLTGKPPFYSASGQNCLTPGMKDKIQLGDYAFPDNDFQNISEEAKGLIKRMLVVNPNMRITISELMQNPWINQDISNIPETPIHFHTFDFKEAGLMFNNTLNNGLKNERKNADQQQNQTTGPLNNDASKMEFKLENIGSLGKRKNNRKRKEDSSTSSSNYSSNVTGGVN